MSLETLVNPFALASATLAIVCLSAWPIFRSRQAMLLTQLAALGFLVLHYALVGAMTAAVVNLLGATQIVASLLVGNRSSWRWVSYALVILIVASTVVTWQGMISAYAAVGMLLVSIGRAQSGPQTMRLLVLAGTPFWLVHDLMIASPIAIADAACLLIGLWSLTRPDTRGTLSR
jgi:hypothetical protein